MAQTLPLTFDDKGLIPVIVQDHLTGEIRMFAFATPEAVRRTLESGRATFWSRSRGELWEKGQTSGNEILVRRVLVDCDADCLIYSSEPKGSSCHTGAPSCFFRELRRDGADVSDGSEGANGALVEIGPEKRQTMLETLEAILEGRKQSTATASYTKSLYDKGPPAIAAKVREEAGELAKALEEESSDRVASEAADTLYHVLVGLRARSVPWREVLSLLAKRLGQSGHEEKASRPGRPSGDRGLS